MSESTEAHVRSADDGEPSVSEPPKCPVCDDCNPDMILVSNDGVQYATSSKNLYLYSEGFPSPESVQKDEDKVVPMVESAPVVKLMLQFMHRMAQPDISQVEDVDTFFGFAEAAEKWLIFPATQVCKWRIKALKTSHPIRVFVYAAKHKYLDLLDDVADQTLELDYKDMMVHLSGYPDILLAWFLYREGLRKAYDSIQSYKPPGSSLHKGGLARCEEWNTCYGNYRAAVNRCSFVNTQTLVSEAQKSFRGFDCMSCNKSLAQFYEDLAGLVKVESFMSCLRSTRK